MRGTLKDIEVGCRGGEQAHRRVGSLKPFQDLHNVSQALWTRLRFVFLSPITYGPSQPLVVVFLIPIGSTVDLPGMVITSEARGGVGRLVKVSSLRTCLTRPYAANVHKGTASASVAGLGFKIRACVARCQ